MAKKSHPELHRALALKRIRNRTRLEASIRADILLNELEAEFLKEFDRRVAAGEPYELNNYDEWVLQAINSRFPALDG